MALSLTVDVEEWYHGLWPGSDKIVSEYYGHKIPKGTFIEPLQHILEIFEKHNVCSTFFVLGEAAEYAPEMIERIYGLGHEVASHSYLHRDLTNISSTELEKSEKENQHLRRAISDLTLDKLILTEAARGNQRALRAADGASAMCGRRLAYLSAAPAAPWDSTGSHSARFTSAGRTNSC